MRKKKFTLEKKMVAQVRYFETMYLLRDRDGIRIFTTTDDKMARRMLAILNAYDSQKLRLKAKVKAKVKAKPKAKAKSKKHNSKR